MAAITYANILAKKEALMRSGLRLSVIIAIPTATSDATAGVFLVKDPDPGTAPNTVGAEPGNAKGGSGTDGMSWKKFSYADVATAYSV